MAQVIPIGPANRLLTTREAALRLGVSLRTVQLWVEASILPASRTPGGHRRIPYGAVEALALNMGLGAGEVSLAPNVAPVPLQVADTSPSGHAKLAGNSARLPTRADVLLIADDPSWLEGSVHALEYFSDNLTLRVADNGYVGLIHIGERAPELLIISLELPGMDGVQLLRTLETMHLLDDIRVMAITSTGNGAKTELPDGVEKLPWPISHDALAVRVGRWLLSRQTAQGVCDE
jgi:excisionase family DNA binding protein